ncbi:MAG: cyclic pyranopterin phosphate synthase MoaA, partial [Bacteroidetes bacterium]|nr:cyclic pyranopterin phosphate synthase MoaA [Bacteroidota bacterium]
KEELDLLGALRRGEAIESIIRLSLSRKHAALGGQFGADYRQANPDAIENRSMISIGG